MQHRIESRIRNRKCKWYSSEKFGYACFVKSFITWPGVPCSAAVPSMPCLYFEAELKNSSSRIKQMGFFDVDTKEKIFCDIHDGQLLLPQSPHTAPSLTQKECHRAPDVVGCGIMWPVGLVIFTIDGVGTGKFYQFPSNKPLVIQHMLPYVSCSRIRCNYGQRPFLFEHANLEEVRFAAASVLHERDVCNGVKLHEENAHWLASASYCAQRYSPVSTQYYRVSGQPRSPPAKRPLEWGWSAVCIPL